MQSPKTVYFHVSKGMEKITELSRDQALLLLSGVHDDPVLALDSSTKFRPAQTNYSMIWKEERGC